MKETNEINELEEKLEEKLSKEKKESFENFEKSKTSASKKAKAIFWLKIALILALFSYTAYSFPSFLNALKPSRPLRLGSYETDEKTDNCIALLWKAAAENKAGQCPFSGKDYIIKENGDICCSNPNEHGLKSLCYEKKLKSVSARTYDEK